METPITPTQNFFQPAKVLPSLTTLVQSQLAINQGQATSINGVSPEEIAFSQKLSRAVPTSGLESSYNQARKYDDDILGYSALRDNEDLYAQHQGALGSIGSGLGRFALTTLTKVGSSLGYIVSSIGNVPQLFQGDNVQDGLSKFVAATSDNAFSEWMNSLEDDVKTDLLPIYQEASDRNKGFFSRALTDLNFWTDDFVDGAAFMASAWVPGLGIGKLGNAAKALKLINSASKLRNISVGATALLNTTSESFWEANETKKNVAQSLQGKINPETGVEYTPGEIKLAAANAARNTFAANMFALTVSNLWEANLMFKRTPSNKSLGGLSFEEKLLGKATPEKFSLGKSVAKNVAKGYLAEGLWEENIQLAIQRFNESTYAPSRSNKKYSNSILENYFNQIGGAFTGEDQEASLSIGLGALLGGMMGGILQTREDREKNKYISQKATQFNNAVDAFKSLGQVYNVDEDGKLTTDLQKIKNYVDGSTSLARLYEKVNLAEQTGDQSLKNFYNNEIFSQFALAHFELGQGNLLKTKLADAINLSDEDLITLGFDPSSKTEAVQNLSKLQASAAKLESLYNSIEASVSSNDENANLLRKRKLYELGSREILLRDEISSNNSIVDSLELDQPLEVSEVNKLNAKIKVLEKRAEGFSKMREAQELPEWANSDEKSLVALEKAQKELSKYEKENEDILKPFIKDDNGYYRAKEGYNEMRKKQLEDAVEKDTALKLALEDTTNKFNRIFDRKNGEKYFKRYIVQKATEGNFDKSIEDFSKEDTVHLNDKLMNALDKKSFDDLIDRFPLLQDETFPVNQKLGILSTINDERVKKLVDSLSREINVLSDNIRKAREKAEKDREFKEKLERDQAYQDSLNKGMEKLSAEQAAESFVEPQKEQETSSEEPPNQTGTSEQKVVIDFGADKDIVAIASTSEPVWNDTTTDNFHRRHQRFLFNLSQVKPEGPLKVVLVTKKNEESYGLKGFITDENTNPKDATIRVVYTMYQNGKLFFIDENAKKISEVGQPVDQSKIVFSQLTDTSLVRQGKDRYTNKQGKNVAQYQEWWLETRAKILSSSTSLPAYSFSVSRGFPAQKSKTSNQSVVQAGLINEDDLYKPIVQVVTYGTATYEGDVASSRTGVNIPSGRFMLSSGGNIVFLDNHNLPEEAVDQVYRLIVAMAKSSEKQNRLDTSIAKTFLNGVLYFTLPKDNKVPTRSQIWINSGLRTKDWVIPFTSLDIIENEEKIKKFLRESYHNVSKPFLNKLASAQTSEEREFVELQADENFEVSVKYRWPSYNHYLLSDKTPDGKARTPILTTTIEKPSDRPPIVGKYSVMEGEPFMFNPPSKQQEPPVKPSNSSEPSSGTSIFKTNGGETITYTGNTFDDIVFSEDDQYKKAIQRVSNTPLVAKIISENPALPAEDVAESLLRKAIVNSYSQGTVASNSKQEATPTEVKPDIKSDSPNPSVDDLLSSAPDEVDDLSTRVAPIDYISNDYKRANLDEEEAWYKERFPASIPFKRVKTILKTTSGGLAWGAFQRGAVYIFENAEIGTAYHEAFEVVWGAFLTGDEQSEIFKEFKEREGGFTTFDGKYKPFEFATLKEAKEQMAEEFRDYVMTGELPKAKKRASWFKQLLNFIVELLIGKQDKINSLFERIQSGEFKDYSVLHTTFGEPQYREVKGAPEAFVQDTIEAMASTMFSLAFNEDADILNRLEEKGVEAVAPLYDQLFNRLEKEFSVNIPAIYKKAINSAVTDEEKESLKKQLSDIVFGDGQNGNAFGWAFIKNNWSKFVKDHQSFMRIFDVEFSVDDDGKVVFDENSLIDSDEPVDRGYDRDIFKINVKNSASKFVKLLFATLPDSEFTDLFKENWKAAQERSIEEIKAGSFGGQDIAINRRRSTVKLPKLVQYAKTFNYVLHNVAGSDSIYSITDKLAKLAQNPTIQKNANIYRLLNRLKLSKGFEGKTFGQIKGIMKVENALMKQKPEFYGQFYAADGSVTIRTTNLSSKSESIKNEWVDSLKSSDAVEVNKKEIKFKNNIQNLTSNTVTGIIDFANTIGIKISLKDYISLEEKDKKAITDQIVALRKIISENLGKTLQLTSGKGLDINGRYKKIADIYVNKILGDDTESQHSNIDKEATSNFVLNNYVSTILNNAHDSTSREEFERHNPWFNKTTGDIWFRDSLLIDKIFTDKKPIYLGVTEGRIHENGPNRSISSLSIGERTLYEFNNNLLGIFNVLLPADSKNEWIINTGQYIPASRYFNSLTRIDAKSEFYNYMYRTMSTEIELARDYESRKHIIQLTKKINDRPVGKSLRFFRNILSKSTVDKIHSQVIDNHENIENILPMQDFIKEVDNFILDKKTKTRERLEKSRFILRPTGFDKIRVMGVLTNFLDTHLGSKKFLSPEEVDSLIEFREINYIMNNIEMHKTFFGDPAIYKDELKRIKSFMSGRENTHVDLLNNEQGANFALTEVMNKGLKPGDIGYHVFKNHLNSATLFDVLVQSKQHDEISSKLGDSGSQKYDGLNEADAQSWISLPAYREMLIKAARWTDLQEDQFKYEMAWERNEKNKKVDGDDEILKKGPIKNVFFPILKPIGSGVSFQEGIANINLDKTSTAPLVYRFIKGRELEHLYNAMQEKGIDYVRMESAHKVGMSSKSTTSFYNDNGEVNSEGIKALTPAQLPFRFFGIQVETGGKKKDQTEGSQARKITVSDIMNAGVPIDYSGSKEDWDSLSEEAKLKTSDKYRKVMNHQNAERDLVNAHYQKALKMLGIVDNGDSFTVENTEKIREFILNELERRELPQNISDAIRSGQYNYEALPNYTQIKDIVYSIINKQILRPKVNGGPKVLLSALGWNRTKREKINSKDVYTSSELSFYKIGKDGKTEACEVYLPYFFEKELKKAGSKRSKEEILKYLNTTKEGKELLKGIGFRIPTQGLNSIDFFVVKDFLPEEMGDTVIFPSEITAKAGSDFDIDKMNIYLKNFRINASGYPEVIKFEKIDTNSEEELRDYYERNLLGKYKKFKEFEKSKSTLASASQFLAALGQEVEALSESDRDDISDLRDAYVPSVEEFILQNKGIPLERIQSIEALENRYFDSMIEVLEDSDNYVKLITPNSVDDLSKQGDGLKRIAERIAKLTGRASKEEEKLNYSSLLDSSYMSQQRHNFLIGNTARGVAVTSTTNLVFNQLAGVYLDVDPKSIPFDVNTVVVKNADGKDVEKISIGHVMDAENKYFLSILGSQFVDGYVDVAKGAWIIEMGADTNVAKDYILMTKMGIHPYRVALFMNQPIIQDYFNTLNMFTSGSQVMQESSFTPSQVRNMVMSKYDSLKIQKPEKYTISDMERMITKYTNGETLSKEEQQIQRFMLQDYFTIGDLAWDMFWFVEGYQYDINRINNPAIARRKFMATSDIANTKVRGVEKIFNNTYMGAFKDAVINMTEALSGVFKLQQGVNGKIQEQLSNDFYFRKGINKSTYQSIMSKVETNLLDFHTQLSSEVGGRQLNSFISPLFLNKDHNIGKYILALQDHESELIRNNPFIQNLIVSQDIREGYPTIVRLKNKDFDSYTSNMLTASYRELLNNGNTITVEGITKKVSDVMKSLAIASILSTGATKTGKSFTHLIPNELYSSIVSGEFSDDYAQFYLDQDIFYRTNWMDDDIVPTLPPVYDEFDQSNVYYPQIGNSPSQIEMLKQAGVNTDEFKLLLVDKYEWSGKPYLKTIDYPYIEINGTYKKDYSNPIVRLYKRLQGFEIDIPNDFDQFTTKKIVYKPVIKWGDGKVQEFYSTLRQSSLAANGKIDELSDSDVYKIISGENITPDEDEFGTEPTGPSPTEPTGPVIEHQGQSQQTQLIQQQQEQQQTYYPPISSVVKQKGKKVEFTVPGILGAPITKLGYKLSIPEYPEFVAYLNNDNRIATVYFPNGQRKVIGTQLKLGLSNFEWELQRMVQNLSPENIPYLTSIGIKPITLVDKIFNEAKENKEIKKDC